MASHQYEMDQADQRTITEKGGIQSPFVVAFF
jgi:hypothetical protein